MNYFEISSIQKNRLCNFIKKFIVKIKIRNIILDCFMCVYILYVCVRVHTHTFLCSLPHFFENLFRYFIKTGKSRKVKFGKKTLLRVQIGSS